MTFKLSSEKPGEVIQAKKKKEGSHRQKSEAEEETKEYMWCGCKPEQATGNR